MSSPFAALGLGTGALRAVEARGYETPTPVQAAAIPAALAGRDVWALVGACIAMQAHGTDLLAASIASADVLTRLIAAGAAAATLKAELIASLATDPVTEAAMAQFAQDAQASLSALATE